MDYQKIPSPCYVVDERALRRNLELIRGVSERSGAQIILALKANATWAIFPIIREYVPCTTASSVCEARLAFEQMGTLTHTYAPVYTEREFAGLMEYSSHITFNSLTQFERFGARAIAGGISCGLRVNPEFSTVETELYNPASPTSRLGITADRLPKLPVGVEGLHFHTLCESRPEALRGTLAALEQRFGHLLPSVKWLNMGGGHLMTAEDYDVDELIAILTAFMAKYPHLRIILEPGSAFTWRTGWLVSTIEDIVHNGGVGTLMLDVSFACHMPDTLEMPYKPAVIGAHEPAEGEKSWRLGGNCCLAGDFKGDYAFDREPAVGDRLVFEDMIHYTMVKTTMFNGVAHPAIAILTSGGALRMVREFGYEDFKNRMS